MNGFVSHEREKFERMAKEMQDKDRDLLNMDTKLRKVQKLISLDASLSDDPHQYSSDKEKTGSIHESNEAKDEQRGSRLIV